MKIQDKLLINGVLIIGQGDALPVYNPATGEIIAQVREASPKQITAAVRAAEEAFESYSRTPPSERAALLLQIADVIETHQDELAELESLDVGKPWPSARDDEMPLTIDTFRFFAGAARTMTGVATGGICRGAYLHDTARCRRDGRCDCALELSVDDGGVEAGRAFGGGV